MVFIDLQMSKIGCMNYVDFSQIWSHFCIPLSITSIRFCQLQRCNHNPWRLYYTYTYTYMWPDLRKAGFHTHNSKTHFSPSNVSCTSWLTIQPGIDAESCPGCFCCGLFLRLVRRPRVYGSPSNGWISTWQADSWL